MNKKLLLLLSFISCIIYCNGQNPLVKQWDKRFGGGSEDRLISLITQNDGFVLGGCSWSDSSGDKTQNLWSVNTPDFWVLKTDSAGNKIWDRNFGGSNIDIFTSMCANSSGYLLGGYSISGISGDKTGALQGVYDYWIVKIDSAGNKQWDKDFGGSLYNYLYSVNSTSDGGYILGGISNSGIGGNKTQACQGLYDYWILKIDSVGNKLWDKTFGGTNQDYLSVVKQTSDKGYILGGFSDSPLSGDKTMPSWGLGDYWLVKTDSLGNKQWDIDIGGTLADVLIDLVQTSDNGFVLGGQSLSGISGNKTQNTVGLYDFWIVKIDSAGVQQWDKDYGGVLNEEFFSVKITVDNGLLLSGDSYSNISGNKTEDNLGVEQIWVIKTDSSGNQLWDKTVFTLGHDENGMANDLQNGCYVFSCSENAGIGGYRTQPSQGLTDYWLIKFCDSTLTGSSVVNGKSSMVSIYPNPFEDELAISSGQLEESKTQIEVTDIFGRKIYSNTFPSANCQLKTANWNKGIYFVQV